MGLLVTVIVIGLITAIVLIALGLLAAHLNIIAWRPDAPSDIYPILYQGWISCICGIWVLLNGVLALIALRLPSEDVAKSAIAAAALAIGPIDVVLGLLLGYLGYALLTKQGEQARQIRLGYLAVVFGVLAVYPTFFFWFFFRLGSAVHVQVGPALVQ
jgi:hypothetical protein